MLIAARNAMMVGKRLPYDAEVEYLESTGMQWIDTGYIPNENTIIQLDVQFTSTSENWTLVTGRRSIIGTNTFLFLQFTNTNGNPYALYYCVGPQAGQLVNYANPLDRHSITLSVRDRRLILDNVVHTTSYTIESGSNYSLNMFSNKKADDTLAPGQPMRQFVYKVWDNTALVRDFISVRVGTTGAIYDRLGVGGMNPDGSARDDGMYFNRGTGAFVIGPDK